MSMRTHENPDGIVTTPEEAQERHDQMRHKENMTYGHWVGTDSWEDCRTWACELARQRIHRLAAEVCPTCHGSGLVEVAD